MRRGARAEAAAAGLTRYFTGMACRNGHVAERFVKGGTCVLCKAAAVKTYYEEHPEWWRGRSKAWREKNPERAKERVRAWHAANPDYAKQWSRDNAEHVRQKSRQWYHDNTARRLAVARAWAKANPEKAATYRAYRARLAAAPGSFTKEDIEAILERQGYRCTGCDADLLRRFDVDHIIPLSRGGTNWPDNLQCLCHPCNTSKGDKTMDEWRATV